MRLTTVEQVAKKSSAMCHRTSCHNLGAIHFNPKTEHYYCAECMHAIEKEAKFKFYRPMIDCAKCRGGSIRFLAPQAGVCDSCHKKLEVPNHKDLVSQETKAAAQKIQDDIENLFSQYERKPQAWALVSNLAYRLKQEVDKL